MGIYVQEITEELLDLIDSAQRCSILSLKCSSSKIFLLRYSKGKTELQVQVRKLGIGMGLVSII